MVHGVPLHFSLEHLRVLDAARSLDQTMIILGVGSACLWPRRPASSALAAV